MALFHDTVVYAINVDFIYLVGRPLGRQCDGLKPNLRDNTFKKIQQQRATTELLI